MIFFDLFLILCFARSICAGCPDGKFECKGDKSCIDFLKTCDGINNCADSSDEKLNCPNGCDVNGTFSKPGSTLQTEEWWFNCSKSRWILSGCVVHNVGFKPNEIFRAVTKLGTYWGVCKQIKPGTMIRQPEGCVDYRDGKMVKNGEEFLLNSAFWAKCIVNKTKENQSISLNDVGWKISGCYNGTSTPVQDGVEFPWIFEPAAIWGVRVKCKVPNQPKVTPILTPSACLVGVNLTNRWEVRALRSKCFMVADDLVFYCEISLMETAPLSKLAKWGGKTASSLSALETPAFHLNITSNSPKELKQLSANGYKPCHELDLKTTEFVNNVNKNRAG